MELYGKKNFTEAQLLFNERMRKAMHTKYPEFVSLDESVELYRIALALSQWDASAYELFYVLCLYLWTFDFFEDEGIGDMDKIEKSYGLLMERVKDFSIDISKFRKKVLEYRESCRYEKMLNRSITAFYTIRPICSASLLVMYLYCCINEIPFDIKAKFISNYVWLINDIYSIHFEMNLSSMNIIKYIRDITGEWDNFILDLKKVDGVEEFSDFFLAFNNLHVYSPRYKDLEKSLIKWIHSGLEYGEWWNNNYQSYTERG